MNNLPVIDLGVIVAYLAAMLAMGFYFSKKNKNPAQFTKASGKIPVWAVGISIYATFLSSNTFIGVPGKAFGGNWNAFVFSLSMPLAAWIAARYFVPFYRKSKEISAYTHLEKRFGPWARTYAVICFLLTQLARIGSIFFGVALCMQALTGYPMWLIMLVTGVCIIVYTVLGGMEAIIWTDVVQASVLTAGALVVLVMILHHTPGGLTQIVKVDMAHHKFSLGSFAPGFRSSTFWVVLLYGFFINLNNFGIDQNYVQRYHTARGPRDAARSIWLCVWMYVPVSLLFFIIGAFLFAYYQLHPALFHEMQMHLGVAAGRVGGALAPADYGDKVLPYFVVHRIPAGLTGLIIAAILSAAMSTISSGMNASATVFSVDIVKRYFRPQITETGMLRLLYVTTALVGLAGIGTGISLIGVQSILDIWWELSGIFAGGMLGLFLLGIIGRAKNRQALTATLLGIAVILWMSLSHWIPERYGYLRNPLHADMIIVVGTLTILLSGMLFSSGKNILSNSKHEPTDRATSRAATHVQK